MDRWVVLAALFLSRVAMGFQFQSIGSISPFLVSEYGIDYATIGTLVGLYMLPGVLLALPSGMITKRFGDKRAVAFGLLMMTAGGITAGVADGYELLWAGRLVSGIGVVFLFVSMTKMVADWFAGRDLVLAMATFMSGWPVGIGLALVTQADLAAAQGAPAVFLATGIGCAVSLLLFIGAYRNPPGATAPEGPQKIFGLSRRETILISTVGILWALNTTGWLILISFAPAFFVAQGMSPTEAGMLTSMNSWIAIITMPLGGFVASRAGYPNTILVTCLLAKGVFVICLVWYPSMPILWFALMAIVGSLPSGIAMSLPAEVLRRENRGPGMGVFYTWFYAGAALLPAFAGWTKDMTGSHAAPIIVAGLLVVITVPMLGVFRYLQRTLAADAPPVARPAPA